MLDILIETREAQLQVLGRLAQAEAALKLTVDQQIKELNWLAEQQTIYNGKLQATNREIFKIKVDSQKT